MLHCLLRGWRRLLCKYAKPNSISFAFTNAISHHTVSNNGACPRIHPFTNSRGKPNSDYAPYERSYSITFSCPQQTQDGFADHFADNRFPYSKSIHRDKSTNAESNPKPNQISKQQANTKTNSEPNQISKQRANKKTNREPNRTTGYCKPSPRTIAKADFITHSSSLIGSNFVPDELPRRY
jgi:hypothetical protein